MLRNLVRPTSGLIKHHVAETATVINYQQKRYEVLVKRMYPPRLYKKGHAKPLKRREYVYILEENTDTKPAGDLEVILTIDIKELGYRGDVISVPKRIARNNLLPVGAALYPTDENLALRQKWIKEEPPKLRRSKTVERTIQQLEGMNLPIPMNPNKSWVLNKSHIRVALRLVGVEVDDSCISLPAKEITEPEEFEFIITVNKVHKAKVKAHIHPCTAETLADIVDLEVFSGTFKSLQEHISEAVLANNLTIRKPIAQ